MCAIFVKHMKLRCDMRVPFKTFILFDFLNHIVAFFHCMRDVIWYIKTFVDKISVKEVWLKIRHAYKGID